MRLPKAELVVTLVERAHTDLDRAANLWPLVQEHYHRGGVRLPAGSEGGGHPAGTHSDPTASAAVAVFQSGPECAECDEYGNCAEHMRSKDIAYIAGPGGTITVLKVAQPRSEGQKAGSWWFNEDQMRQAMLAFRDALRRLEWASHALVACVPAQASALAVGRPVTDGRTEAEVVALADRRRATRGDLDCLACQRPAARLISGMCSACYQSWRGAGSPERAIWFRKRRADLEERQKRQAETAKLGEWDTSVHFSRGPADGVDRRAA